MDPICQQVGATLSHWLETFKSIISTPYLELVEVWTTPTNVWLKTIYQHVT
jgi:hypothetical protein